MENETGFKGIEKLEEFLERYSNERDFLIKELGRIRYAEMMDQISDIIKRHKLLPSQAEKLFNHLVDTFRAEHTHV